MSQSRMSTPRNKLARGTSPPVQGFQAAQTGWMDNNYQAEQAHFMNEQYQNDGLANAGGGYQAAKPCFFGPPQQI